MTKPSQRSVPQKQGLQSLGKIPTARKAPANLPSLKAEITTTGGSGGGQDGGGANVAAPVATGGGGPGAAAPNSAAGWKDEGGASAGGGGGSAARPKDKDIRSSSKDIRSSSASDQHHGRGNVGRGGPGSWIGPLPGAGSVVEATPSSGVVTNSFPVKAKPSFLHKQSPLFGQEFPSLGGAGPGGGGAAAAAAAAEHAAMGRKEGERPKQPAGGGGGHPMGLSGPASGLVSGAPSAAAKDAKYGPGPNLRPQTSGNWMFGRGNKEGEAGGPATADQGKNGASSAPVCGQQKPDFPSKPVFPPPPPIMMPMSKEGRRGGMMPSRAGGGMSNGVNQRGAGASSSSSVAPVAIIDREKLRRMDVIDTTEDDWAKTDDTFDYNKKLAR